MTNSYDVTQLNEAQAAAVAAIDGPVLVLAGAGSGKTRVLTHRVANMLSHGISARNILAITFTNKAANEMKSRLYAMCPNVYGLTVCTIHSLCVRILREYAETLGYTASFTIYDEQDSETVVKRLLKKEDTDDKTLRRIVNFISQCKTYNLNAHERAELCADDSLSLSIYRAYNDSLKRSNAMDFDDLLLNTLHLLNSNQYALELLQQRYRYISIDEFQDTNRVQYLIFKKLAERYGNLFVVGDDDQSIYGWRGAEVENILGFQRDYPSAKIFKLEQNYRSTDKILAVANEIIGKNSERYGKQLYTVKKGGVRVETYVARDERDEARYVISQLVALRSYYGYSFSDFAVLMRVNSLTRSIEQECLQYGIPCKVFGGFKFYERKEVKDVLAYLRLVNNPFDNESLLRAINTPKRGIGKTTCDRLAELSAEYGLCIVDVLSDQRNLECFNAGTRARLTDFYALFCELEELSRHSGLLAFTEKLIKRINYRAMLLSLPDGEDKNFNIDELLASVDGYVKENGDGATLADYLQSVSLTADRANEVSDDDGNYVTISTVHSAKGLEFNTVFIIGLDEGIFPITRATYLLKEQEEERRLAYVAVTRAKERLYLTRAQSRFMYGERNYCLPSRYFTEVSELLKPTPVPRYDADGTPAYNFEAKATAQRQISPPNAAKKVIPHFSPADKVVHTVFGEGMVLSVDGDTAVVAFATVGKKTLSLKYAPLSKK